MLSEERLPGRIVQRHRTDEADSLRDDSPMDCQRCGLCGELWGVVMDDRLAAALLRHLAALPVHGTAAGAFSVAHRQIGHAGHHRRSRRQQKQYSDEADETAHGCLDYRTFQEREICYKGIGHLRAELPLAFVIPLGRGEICGLGCRYRRGRRSRL